MLAVLKSYPGKLSDLMSAFANASGIPISKKPAVRRVFLGNHFYLRLTLGAMTEQKVIVRCRAKARDYAANNVNQIQIANLIFAKAH